MSASAANGVVPMTKESLVVLSIASEAGDTSFAAVELHGLDAGVTEALRQRRLTQAEWATGFAVFVNGAVIRPPAQAAILAEYGLLADGVRLTPAYPWMTGLSYRACADLSRVLSGTALPPAELVFSFPKETCRRAAEVDSIYPSGGVLPENLLRFYVNFSAPMQRGGAYDQITLHDEDGCAVADALYRPPVELWDLAMRRLTVLLDPGRLKRNVGPNVRLGAPMREGCQYTLFVGAGLVDASGSTLKRPYTKRFFAGAAVRTRILPAQWQISAPRDGTVDPLQIKFPVPLDSAAESGAILVVDNARNRLAGRPVLDRDQMRWTFTPVSPWTSGETHLLIDPGLEDVCGNTLDAPFDVPAGAVEQAAARSFEVSVCAASI